MTPSDLWKPPFPLALLVLALVVTTAAAQPAPVELEPGLRSPYAQLGEAAAAVGDVTGDGRPDFLVGAPTHLSSFHGRTGRAYLFDGETGALVHQLVPPDGLDSARGFGGAVAPVGDLDGDGLAEVAVGGRYATDPERVFIYNGDDGTVVHALAPPASPFPQNFGVALVATGDLDGDGIPDLLVGAAEAGADRSGVAYLFSGATGEIVRTLTPPAQPTPRAFGYGVAALGDTDGDGVTDFAVGDLDAQPELSLIGAVHVFSGATGAFRYTVTPVEALNGGRFGDNSGMPIEGLGDVDGDGFADFAVGAETETVGLTTEGSVYVFSGADGAPLYRIEGTDYVGQLGAALAAIPDVDGDAVPDLLVGAPGEGGGGPFSDGTGRVHVRSGATGGAIAVLHAPEGVSVHDHFGAAVAGFVRADGALRLAAGAPNVHVGDFDEVGQGRVYLYEDAVPALALTLLAAEPPLLVPVSGGTLTLTARLTNTTDAPLSLDAWVVATLPDGTTMRQAFGQASLPLAPHSWVTRTFQQRVPAAAPPGSYAYTLYVGDYPSNPVLSASVGFGKRTFAPQASVEEKETQAPLLGAPQPNPFTGRTVLPVTLPEAGRVRLAVYDLLGREVAVLLDGEHEAGVHTVPFDGQGLAGGVYLARLETRGGVQTRRLTVMR